MYYVDRRGLLKAGAALVGTAALGRAGAAFAAEGTTLTVYNGQHAQLTDPLFAAFTEATGIKLNVRRGSSTQLANQIMEEGDNSPADVFYAEESAPIIALSEKDFLAPIDAASVAAIDPRWVGKKRDWTGITARCRVVTFNPDMIAEKDLPPSVMDFATEAWKDKVAYVPTSGAFQEQIVVIMKMEGREAALNWLKGLKQFGRPYNGNMAVARAVEKGEIATGLINNYYWYAVAHEVGIENMKSKLHYMRHKDPGAMVSVSAAGIIATTRRAEAAQKLIAYMVGEEGQSVIAKAVAEYPLNPKVKSTFALEPFDKLDPPDVPPAAVGDALEAIKLRKEAGLG
jgi:iron(III) transport system substrate-binding protein